MTSRRGRSARDLLLPANPAASALSASQVAAVAWLRDSLPHLGAVPLPGRGATAERWRTLTEIAALDLAVARLTEGHLDALAILAELGGTPGMRDQAWGVWAAEPGRVQAERADREWHLRGEKRWCSGAQGLDRALVTATAPDGPRLFVVDPADLDPVVGSWPAIGMEATASLTMRFDLTVDSDAAIGAPDAYVERPGFWHGGAGVTACWFGGALGVAERLRTAATRDDDHELHATWGRVKARLEAAAALLQRSAAEIDADPGDIHAARRRAMRLRLVVEEAARFTITETTVALGAGPLAHERDYAQHVGDLELYVRQLRPDGAAADFGAQYGNEPIAW